MAGDTDRSNPTPGEWEARLGKAIHDLRVHRRLSLSDAAGRAGIQTADLERIEHGGGGSIAMLVAIACSMGKEGWLEGLAPVAPPPAPLSPLQRLRERQTDTANKLALGRRKRD